MTAGVSTGAPGSLNRNEISSVGAGQAGLRRVPTYLASRGCLECRLGSRGSEKGRFAMVVAAATVVVLLWGFGVELVLHNQIFVSPPVLTSDQNK
jgi:hypothetical protein